MLFVVLAPSMQNFLTKWLCWCVCFKMSSTLFASKFSDWKHLCKWRKKCKGAHSNLWVFCRRAGRNLKKKSQEIDILLFACKQNTQWRKVRKWQFHAGRKQNRQTRNVTTKNVSDGGVAQGCIILTWLWSFLDSCLEGLHPRSCWASNCSKWAKGLHVVKEKPHHQHKERKQQQNETPDIQNDSAISNKWGHLCSAGLKKLKRLSDATAPNFSFQRCFFLLRKWEIFHHQILGVKFFEDCQRRLGCVQASSGKRNCFLAWSRLGEHHNRIAYRHRNNSPSTCYKPVSLKVACSALYCSKHFLQKELNKTSKRVRKQWQTKGNRLGTL